MVMRCPFCVSDISEQALVCANCGRDVAIPDFLRREQEELTRKRDRLRLELAEIRARLAAPRGRRAPDEGRAS